MEDKIKHHALNWWNNLTSRQQQDYEFKAFGYGDPFEDNSLVEADIIKMYKLLVK